MLLRIGVLMGLWCTWLGAASAGFATVAEAPSVSFQGRPVRFSNSEKPYYLGNCVMVSLRPVCSAMGASVRHSRDAIHWTVTRGEDRIDYALGDSWIIFNGAKKEMPERAEGRGDVLFVPFEFVDEMSGGGLAINWEGTSSKTPEIFYRAKPLRFRRDEQPLRIGGAVYVAVRPTASAIGVGVEGGDRKPLVLTRALDRLTYEPGHHSFVFNEAQKLMRNPSFSKGRNLFVPIELFRALVGDELYSR